MQYYNVFSLPYDFLKNVFFSLAYVIVQIQYIIHITYKMGVNRPFMLLVSFPVKSGLLVVWAKSRVTHGFSSATGVSRHLLTTP